MDAEPPKCAVPPRTAIVAKADPVRRDVPVLIPPGHHAHRRADGTVIVHADTNYGNAAAHAGVVWPWPKVGYAGQVMRTAPAVCPPGKP